MVLHNAYKLKDIPSGNQSPVFINEDLTPLRSRLLHYVKTNVPGVISKSVHSRQGRILCKTDSDQTKWTFIDSVRDLNKFEIELTDGVLKDLGLDTYLLCLDTK